MSVKAVHRYIHMIIMYFISCFIMYIGNMPYKVIKYFFFFKLQGKRNYVNKGTEVGINTIWWVPIRHFELIRGWQGTAKLSVRMWINGNLTPVNCCYSYCFLSGTKELSPFFILSIIVHLLNFEFLYLCIV